LVRLFCQTEGSGVVCAVVAAAGTGDWVDESGVIIVEWSELSFLRFFGMPLHPRRDGVKLQAILEATHREQTGCFPSHFRCLDRHSVQASGDGLTAGAGDGSAVVVVMIFANDHDIIGRGSRRLRVLQFSRRKQPE
jgi:hypothetical protein